MAAGPLGPSALASCESRLPENPWFSHKGMGAHLPHRSTAIVNKDAKSTLRLLYYLFRKHKLDVDRVPHGTPN